MGTILVAEEEENDLFLLKWSFRQARIRNPLQVAQDGQRAVDYLSGIGQFSDRIRHPMPCLVVLNLNMPRLTGMEVLQWIRDQHHLRSLPILMFTSAFILSEAEAAYQVGANAFVTKPHHLGGWTARAELIKECWLSGL